MTEDPAARGMTNHYQPGDQVNGYTLGLDNRWYDTMAWNIEVETERRVASAKNRAWLFWLLLGGVNAHLAVRYPKNGTVIVVASVLLAIFTLGLSMLAWVFTWAFLLGDWHDYRLDTRAQVELETLNRLTMYRAVGR